MPRLLGVDIDSRRLRVAVADLGFRRLQVVHEGEIILPGDKEQHAEAFSEALRRWGKEFSPDGVVIGLPLRWFSWTQLDLPAMAAEDARRALRFEMDKYLPLPFDDYRSDFIAVKTENRMRTIVFSVRRELVDGCVKAVTDAGLKVAAVRCRTAELLNAVSGGGHVASVAGIFLYASDEDYELMAAGNGSLLQVKRVVPSADLRGELESLRQQYPGKAYAAGDYGLLPEGIAAERLQLSPARALLATFGGKRKFTLEFMPPELARQKRDYYPYAIAGCAIAAIAFFLLTGIVAYLKDMYTLGAIERQISAIKTRASGVIEARKRLEALQEDRKTVTGFLDHSNLAIKALHELSETVPSDSWIINLSLDDKGNIEMEGFSRKTADLVLALEKSGHFQAISFSAPIISREGEERYSLKLEVKGR